FQALRVFRIGASWGGVSSLVAPSDPRATRTTLDWLPNGQLVRLSIGLEDVDDLKNDLERFFACLETKRSAPRGAG
ncbi:MAG: PLP-dependent transferase, partial [Hyphomicrobiaceae bacterium]